MVARDRVAAPHAAQDAVGARLHRQVQVGADVGVEADLLHHARREVARVGGDEAQPAHAGHRRHGVQQVGEVGAGLPGLAPVVDGLAQELDLDEAVATRCRTSRRISASGRLRSGPRVVGTMQKVQLLSQPSMIVTMPLWVPSRLMASMS